jgi:regulator of sirC expression with transglutaminase-like and TPR domain
LVARKPFFSTPAEYVDTLTPLPEGQIDHGLVALSLAKEFYPDINVDAYSKTIDSLAERVRRLVNDSDDPNVKVDAINTVLFEQENFDYDLEALAGNRDEPGFLNVLLDTKKGNCVSLPALYMAIAHRLGYPIYPVFAPAHIFLRYVDPRRGISNIETTHRGIYYPDKDYIESFNLDDRAGKVNNYLRTGTYREFLGCLVDKSASRYSRLGQPEKAIAYLEKAATLAPVWPNLYASLSLNHAILSALTDGDAARAHLAKDVGYDKQAKGLGFVALSETDVWKKLQKDWGR